MTDSPLPVENVKFAVTLANGKLSAPFRGKLAGVPIDGQMHLSQPKNLPTISLKGCRSDELMSPKHSSSWSFPISLQVPRMLLIWMAAVQAIRCRLCSIKLPSLYKSNLPNWITLLKSPTRHSMSRYTVLG